MNRAIRLCDGALEAGLVALMVLAPLPEGSVRSLAQVMIVGGVALLLTLSIVRMSLAGELRVCLSPVLWPGLAMAGLVGWQMLSPTGSVDPHATRESARLFFAYLGLLLVVSMLPMTRARATRLMGALVVSAVILAGVGFARQIGFAEAWLGHPGARLTSTFINPNHQALYFSLALFVSLGLVLRPSGRGAGAPGRAPRRNLPATVLLVGGLLFLALALVLTLSRGGVVSTMAGLFGMLVLALSARSGRRSILPVVAAVLAVVTYSGWVGLEAVADRFATVMREPVSDLRLPVWKASLRVVSEAPVTGIGLGAFQDGFRPFRPADISAEKVVDYAHNDFLQLFAETGILGLFIGIWAGVALLTFMVSRWRGRRDPFARGVVLGGVGAVVATLAHSVMDFGLHMPANAVVLTMIAGLMPVVVTLHQDGREERVGLTAWRVPMSPALGVALVVLSLTVTGFLLVGPGVGAWHAEAAGRMMRGAWQERNAPTQADLLRARTHLQTAVAWDRRNPGSWAELAEISAQVAGRVWSHGIMPNGARVSDTTTLARFQAAEPFLNETRDAYRESLRLRPRAADVHERLGRFLSGMESARLAVRRETGQAPAVGGTNGARGSDGSLVPEALVHFREAIRWDPQNAYYHRSLGLFAQRFSVDQGGRDIASEALGQALALRPDFLPGIVDALLARRVDDGSLIAAMPRKFEVFLDLGRVLEERGRHRTATAAFEEAVRLAQGPAQEVEARVTYARVLVARKETLAALDQARSALVAAPREAEVFALLALIHAQMKKDSEAETALATAVSLAESGPPSRRNRLRGELAALYVSRGQWDRAMGLWREVLRERPNDGWAHFELGRMLERAGDAAGALQEYKTVSAVAGDAWDLHHLVARALRDAGYLREAVASYETAQRINPTDADLGAELGDLYARIGLGQRAIEQYRLVLQREPDHLGARRGLANVRAGAAGS